MTLAGTRPPTLDEWNKYELHHRARLAIKPGITGMWQVSGRSEITDFEEVTYEIRKGRSGEYTKELWIDRREKSKSLAWSSVLLALRNMKKVGEVVDRPKALGDIRGVTYIYGMFYRFGLIDVPDEVKEKMGYPQNRKNRMLSLIEEII